MFVVVCLSLKTDLVESVFQVLVGVFGFVVTAASYDNGSKVELRTCVCVSSHFYWCMDDNLQLLVDGSS